MQEHLAIASVPVQEWGDLYEQEEALRIGTVFRDLNKPFFAAPSDGVSTVRNCPTASAEQQERENMMTKIEETGFVLDDMRLYLDTHPSDAQGLALLKRKLAERQQLLTAFAEKFYPLTMDCMTRLCEKAPESDCYCWQKGPLPWEGACV